MMQYTIEFIALYDGGAHPKKQTVEAANPLEAVNRILSDWECVHRIKLIQANIETDAGDVKTEAELEAGRVRQQINVNITK